MKCNLIEIDRCLHKKGHYVLPQTHEGLEIICYLRGKGSTTIGGEKYEFNADDIAIIPSDTEHDEIFFEDGCLIYCIFDCDNIDLSRLSKRLIAEKHKDTKNVYEILNRIIVESLAEDNIFEELIDLLLQELVLQIYRLCDFEKSEEEIVKQAKQYMRMMYVHPINFDILSEHLGYSYDRLRHIFKKNEGISMKRYLTNVRIGKAQNLLINTEYSIGRIALMCGYGGVSNFIVSFKNVMNVTPTQYRKHISNATDKTFQFNV